MTAPYRSAPSRYCLRCERELFPYSRSRDAPGYCTGCGLRVLAETRARALDAAVAIAP
jgi:DNA-directed RNA polymerase subunit RPC12/RpoP